MTPDETPRDSDVGHGGPVRRISVVVPMYNEADHISSLVADLAAQDFGGELEVLVADGRSSDGSVALLERAAAAAGLAVTVIDNADRWVSHGLNACIRMATGDLIARVDCHSRYPPDYLRLCAEAAEQTGADNVGGRVVAEGRTRMERAVACAMHSPFGGIGWTRWESTGGRTEVDTVTHGAFRPSAFARAGLFDETLVRNQDDELNFRLRRAGGRIVLDPAIHLRYIPRGSVAGVFRQYREYGRWKIPVMAKHRAVISARSLAPLAFSASLLGLGLASVRSGTARRLLGVELTAYGLAAAAFGAAAVRSRRESWSLLPRVVAVFPAFHAGYGTGMLEGCARRAAGFFR